MSKISSQNNKKIWAIFPALMILIFLSEMVFVVDHSMAQEGFKWGRMEIHPGVSIQSKYSDNVFLRPQTNSDFIFTISPSLILKRKKQKGDNLGFDFKYLGEQELFARLKDQDYYNQYAWGTIELGDIAGDINWTMGGHYANARNPISPEFASSILNIRQIRTTYELNSSLLWKLTHKLKADIDAQFSRNLFSDDELQEYNQYDGSGTLNWQTTSLTAVGVNYSFRRIEYLKTSPSFFNNIQHSSSLLAKWEPISIFSSEFHIGWSHTEISDLGKSDRGDIIYKVELNYKPRKTSSWILSGFQEIPISFWINNAVYQRTVAQLIWNQKLGVKWKSLSKIAFEYRKYDTATPDIFSGSQLIFRKDNYFYGLFSLTYSIKSWLDVIMEYEYTNNDSNFQEVDYSSNAVLLRFSFIL